MANIVTSGHKRKILENERHKLQEEVRQQQAELGLRGIKSLKGQNEYQQLEDMKNEQGKIEEIMQSSEERRKRELTEKRKARKISAKEAERRHLEIAKRRKRDEFNKRKINL